MRKAGRWTAAACAAAFAGATVTGSASAAVVDDPIVEGLAGPLQFQVTGSSLLLGQAFSGALSRVKADGTVTDLVSEPGSEIAGVAQGRFGRTFFTYTSDTAQEVRTRSKTGTVDTVADIGAYEARKNPDAKYTYGILGLDDACEAKIPERFRPYQGIVESHPYALARTRHGLFLADAAANAIFFVRWNGKVRTVAVLPPQPYRITAEAAEGAGLDECVVDKVFNFEAVPTDVELSRHGLIVSTLPGGPEDPSLGARGSVYRIGWHGVRRIAKGFLGAANVAVSPRGTIYVTELFGDKVSKISTRHCHHGHHKHAGYGGHGPRISTVVELTQPAGLEWSRGRLYVSSNVFGPGQIATISR